MPGEPIKCSHWENRSCYNAIRVSLLILCWTIKFYPLYVITKWHKL